jgi:hypothetical protein
MPPIGNFWKLFFLAWTDGGLDSVDFFLLSREGGVNGRGCKSSMFFKGRWIPKEAQKKAYYSRVLDGLKAKLKELERKKERKDNA